MNIHIPVSFTNIAINETHLDALIENMMNVVEMGCSDYIVRIKEPSVFMKAYERVNIQANARRSNKKVILLPYNDDEISATALLNVLDMKETSFIANFLLVVPALSNTPGCIVYDLVTHKFVGPEDQSNRPEYLDKWDSCQTKKFQEQVNLFPHENLLNVYGKAVKVACFTYKPYVLLDLDSLIVPSGRDGTEIRLIDEFCRWINCTVELVREEDEEWGEIFSNETGLGVLGAVAEGRADLGITALYSWYEEFLYLDFSSPSIRAAVTCIAPSPRLLISWDSPLAPFYWEIWICMIFIYIVIASVLVVAQRSSDKAFLISFGILVAQACDDSGHTAPWRKRSVTGALILASLVLCSAYGAGLASTFTIPKFEKSIDTIQDIIDTNSVWGATHDAWVFSIVLSQEPRIKQLVKQFKTFNSDELKYKALTRSMLFSVERLPSGVFAIGDYIKEETVRDYMLMREDFYYEQNVVMLRKSSPYTHKLNTLIGRLHQSGLILAWHTQVAIRHLNYKVQQEVKLSRSKHDVEIGPLSILHVVGIFYMYVLGMSLATVMFVIEMVYKRDRCE